MNNISITVSATCCLISLLLVVGLIFNRPFRRDMLGSSGETNVAGLISAKGAAIVLLCSLFVAGMLYPIVSSNAECHGALHGLRVGLGEKARHNAKSADVETLKGTIGALIAELDDADKSCR